MGQQPAMRSRAIRDGSDDGSSPMHQRIAGIESLSSAEAEALLYEWSEWMRDNQRPPAGEWANWLILAGRGFGKTRVGAEMVRHWVRDFRFVNLIGATAADARDIM